jgi:hypothetical protein
MVKKTDKNLSQSPKPLSEQGQSEERQLELLAGTAHSNESNKAIQACNDWLRLGLGRTIPMLLEQYEFIQENTSPTKSLNTLYHWHHVYDWKARATQFDENIEAFKTAEHNNTVQRGLALTHERLKKLYRLASFLETQLFELSEPDEAGIQYYHSLWVSDVKQIGKGDEIERVDIERFNSALISEYRATLADIAKEVGGRVEKKEVSGKDGGAIETRNTTVVVNAENAHDAGNILKQLAELGAIPPDPSAGDSHPASE